MTGLLLVIGFYLIIGAGQITVPGSANTVGPRFFPYLVGGATVVVAALLGLRILRGDAGRRRAARISTRTRLLRGGRSASSRSPSSPRRC